MRQKFIFSRKYLVQWGFLLGAILMAVGLFSLILVPMAQAARAEAIIRNANNLNLPKLVQGKQVIHSRFSSYNRLNPNRKEPEDPYHRSVIGRYSETVEVEQWILFQNDEILQSRTTERDASSQVVLFDHIFDGERRLFYDGIAGYVSILPQAKLTNSSQSQSAPFPEFARNQGLHLSTIADSSWSKPAWVAQLKEEKPSDQWFDELATETDSFIPASGALYMADLDVIGFLNTWVVDQESGRLIEYERQALTPDGPVVLKRIEHQPPIILSEGALSKDWLDISLENTPIRTVSQPIVPSMTDAITNLGEVASVADFEVFVPTIPESFKIAQTNVFFKREVTPKEVWQQSWVFEIQDAARHGLALETIYLSNVDPNSSDEPSAIAIIQGSSKNLVPLMRKIDPIWSESHPVQLNIADQDITAWIATGGTLATHPEQIAVMLEISETFLFIVGQGYEERQILNVVEMLHIVN